jgi:hypothetical protein
VTRDLLVCGNVKDHLCPGEAKAVPSHDSQTTPALEGILWVVSKPAKSGGPCRGRTYGPLIKSQLLYQLS